MNATLQACHRLRAAGYVSVFPRYPVISPPGWNARPDPAARVAWPTRSVYGLRGYRVDPRKSVCLLAVDDGCPARNTQFHVSTAQWQRLSDKPDGLYASRKAAARWSLQKATFVVSSSPRADGSNAWPFQVLGIIPDLPDSSGFLIGNYHCVNESRPARDRGLDVTFRVRARAGAQCGNQPADRSFIRQLRHADDQPFARQASRTWRTPTGIRSLATAVVGAGLFMILLLVANEICAIGARARAGARHALRALGFRNRRSCGLVVVRPRSPAGRRCSWSVARPATGPLAHEIPAG